MVAAGSSAVAGTAGFIWGALQDVCGVMKALWEQSLSQGNDNPWGGTGVGQATPPAHKPCKAPVGCMA